MASVDVSGVPGPPSSGDEFGRLTREFALGFAYWFAFDVVLAPGSIAHAIRTGAPIAWDQELLRFTGAGLLGAVATPFVLALVRRFPVEGPMRWRRTTLHLLSSAAFSTALIAASCPLAALLLVSERRPLIQALRDEMVSNVMLLSFCMAGFIAIAHAVRSSRRLSVERFGAPVARPATPFLARVAVSTRTGLLMVETQTIDWIETQGNYLALHVGARRHLIRDTSKHFETLLDPERFARIHRQSIVAVDRILEVATLGSGDAAVRLATGVDLRVSRGYRKHLQARLSARTHFPFS